MSSGLFGITPAKRRIFYIWCCSGSLSIQLQKTLSLIICLLCMLGFGQIFSGCDDRCISQNELLWKPSISEYRLQLTNHSPFMVELSVDNQILGVYCSGVEKLDIGNFSKNDCSLIKAVFLDNPSWIFLDDCSENPPGPCKDNNIDGKICYNTWGVDLVEAVLR